MIPGNLFAEDGHIPVDNNRAENAIRPFVVGRKNRLFAHSVKGAQASAIIYSLAATATANGLNVEEYFTRLCRSETILPWEWPILFTTHLRDANSEVFFYALTQDYLGVTIVRLFL